jgi:hypothetical protein
MQMHYGLILVPFAAFSIEMHAASTTNLGAASSQHYERTTDDLIETKNTPRVRIPIVMKSWSEIDATGIDGKKIKTKIPAKPVSQVLRARMEQTNDFYIGDWRVQTTPQKWLKSTNQFQVKLEVFRRFGENGQIEESMGYTTLTGLLEAESDNLFVLNGTARRSFRDRNGKPLLEFEAGKAAPNEGKPIAVSKLAPQP